MFDKYTCCYKVREKVKMGLHCRAQQPLSSRSFHSNEMTFLHCAVLWLGPHPGWCFGFPPIPHRVSRHFPNPRVRPTPCCCVPNDVILVQLPYSCGVLDRSRSVLSVRLEKMRNCFKLLFSPSLVVVVHHLLLPYSFPVSATLGLLFIVLCVSLCVNVSHF